MKKYLFLDRDGTLIREPEDFQIDSMKKFSLLPEVVSSLKSLVQSGYSLVMVSNQDGLGTPQYTQDSFDEVQRVLIHILQSEEIHFEELLICPHFSQQGCACRKPKTELVFNYLARNDWERANSYVIGDRSTDAELARNMGLKSFVLGPGLNWRTITNHILFKPRTGNVNRTTAETTIRLALTLDGQGDSKIDTGLGFFDHMLEQIVKHSGMDLKLSARGDLNVDQHHLIEDVALSFGEAIKEALGQKRGLARYGFWIPMDEASARGTVDLSGRPALVMNVSYPSREVGGLQVEMVEHFFKSLCDSAGLGLHLEASGENTHHVVEGLFKVFGKILGQAIQKSEMNKFAVPSTKGLL